mgnify:CR=1 FL=1
MKTLALLLLIPSLTFAQSVYKCPDSEGRFILQQKPCVGGEGKEIAVKPLENGQGANASQLVNYSNKLDKEREEKRLAEQQERESADKKKAIEESIKAYGIYDGRSRNDRMRDSLRDSCNKFPNSSMCDSVRHYE